MTDGHSTETGVAAEYVADDPGYSKNLDGTVLRDLDDAADQLLSLLQARISAVVKEHPGEPGLMISGGIDSILVGAALVNLGHSPLAVTVVTGSEDGLQDLRGQSVAEHLGLEHTVIRLDTELLDEAASESIRRLGTWELWEVTSAIPVQAAFRVFAERHRSPVFTGAGADALFMGGATLDSDPDTPAGLAEYREKITKKVEANFTRNRLIPDYYERILESQSNDFIQVFQTTEFWRFAMRLDSSLLWRAGPDGRIYDKFVLRHAALRLGVPPEHVWTIKAPLQVSSGVIGALVDSARADLAAQPGQITYADPHSEPVEHTVVRQFLRHLSDTAT
ncbi:MAG: asparagine synthase C-terminal domain-containing protein [Gordonia sp. (in: high G+C Gram-positive bacteria)]